MPMRDYCCETCGRRWEALSRTRTLVSAGCVACGGEGVPSLSVFSLKVWKVDRSNFAAIAPQDANGKPMTLVETQRSKNVDAYRPGEQHRMLVHEAEAEERRHVVISEQAKREAWREVSAKTRTVIRG